jgi:hypothetical protein
MSVIQLCSRNVDEDYTPCMDSVSYNSEYILSTRVILRSQILHFLTSEETYRSFLGCDTVWSCR